VHVTAHDLAAAAARPSLERLVAGAIGSCGVVVGNDAVTRDALERRWLAADRVADGVCETWSVEDAAAGDAAAAAVAAAAACRRAIERRAAATG